MNIQWYPGHMTKAKRAMKEDMKLIDLVIELVDARVPLSSRNPDIDDLGAGKARMVLLNKSDLADERQNARWASWFEDKGIHVVKVDARNKGTLKQVQSVIQEACKEKIERDRRRGILNRPIRTMVVGIPNVGKSTLLSVVSKARPKIANYHFTTLFPNLGVVYVEEGVSFVLADIPGIIEGAAEGAGLGHDFLRHIDRCRLLIHVVDVSGSEGRDPVADFEAIQAELKEYGSGLENRPMLVAGNKVDIAADRSALEALRTHVEGLGLPFYEISAAAQQGTRELMYAAARELEHLPPITVYEPTYVERPPEVDMSEPLEITHEDDTWLVEGPWLQRLMANVNFGDYESRNWFDRMLRQSGLFDRLEEMGIKDGDLVSLYNLDFEYQR